MLENILNILKKGQNKVLYQVNNTKITYIECYQKILILSDNLKKQGNSSVILYGHKSIEQFISILACIVAKRCYIPIDIYTPIERIEEIITQSKATLLIKNEPISINEIENLTIYELNSKYQSSQHYYPTINNNAYIIFTSGSTGQSKGVPITYDNLNHFIKWITNLEEFKYCNNLNILSQASFSFDLSLLDIYFSLYKECTITAIDNNTKNNLNKLYQTLKSNKINFLIITPTFIKLLLLDNLFTEKNYPHLKYIFFCGEFLEVITVKKIQECFPNINIINAYGPTEATCCVCLNKIEKNMLNENILPVGKINTASVKINIINQEIVLKGKSVFNGYLKLKSSNYYQEKNINCYKTGDLGYIKNNFLYCKGRKDDQIKYQGYRIELGDIENNLLKIPGIKAAIAIPKYKDNSNIVKLIKAYIVQEKNYPEDQIKKELSNYLPKYMIPKRIITLDKIPINKNGKYDRKKLKEYDRYM